jgi:FMN phosphatase YigB (HAD superfamily)
MTLEAVTFDFWQTIAREPDKPILHPRRVELWAGILGDRHPSERIDEVLRRIGRHREGLWRKGEVLHAADAAALAAAELDPDIDEDTTRALVDAFVGSGAGVELVLTDAVDVALRELDELGLRLGIICDVGFTSGEQLRDVLDRAGLLGRFDGWAFSDEVGAFKPDRVMFEHALLEIGGVAPERAAHIGDLRRTDIAGARAMGMTAIRYRGENDDPPEEGPEGHLVLDDHAQLTALLRAEGLL